MLSPFTESLDTESEVTGELETLQPEMILNGPFNEIPVSEMESGEISHEIRAGYENSIPSKRLDGLLYSGKDDWMNSPENLAIRKKVYEQHVANTRALGKPFTYNLDSTQTREVDHSGKVLLNDAADWLDKLLAQARSDLKNKNVTIKILSGYRTAENQFSGWVKSFPAYFYWALHKKGLSRNDINGIANYIGMNLAAPGFSNHNHGLAVDFGAQEGANTFTVDTNPEHKHKIFWETKSLLWSWLNQHAATFHFYPYKQEPWHWEFNPGSVKAGQSGRPGSGLSEFETEEGLSEYETEERNDEYDSEQYDSEYEQEGDRYEGQTGEENESPVISEEDLTEQNRGYSSDLGWGNYIYEINDLLLKATGQSGMSLAGESFNRAVALWRMKNGFPFWNVSGLLDAETWKKLSASLGLSPLIFSISDTYSKMGLRARGLSFDAFRIACNGFRKLEKNGELKNNRILSIADFTQSSKKDRLYILDLADQKLILQTKVAHGKKSVKEGAADRYSPTDFSNTSGSNKSSLGFYVTGDTFNMADHNGEERGLSLYIYGKEKDFNSNARARGIWIHKAKYVETGGYSLGCPAVVPAVRDQVVSTLKGGSCFFIYYTDPDYLSKSTLAQDPSFGPVPVPSHEYNEAGETEEETEESEAMTETEEQEENEYQETVHESEISFEEEVPKKFDVDASCGITDYLPVSAVKGHAYLTGIFIPAGFKASDKINIILYLHGLYGYGDRKNGIEYYWKNYSNIRDYLYKSRRNAILIAPTLGTDPQTPNILLKNKNGLDTFISACLKELISKNYVPSSAEPFQLIIAGHSAGGSPMSRIMTGTNTLREHVIECWGFDCFYNYGWTEVLTKNPGILFYHYWAYKNDGTQSGPGYNADQLQKKFSNLKNIKPSAGIHHPQVIGDAWINEVNKRSWFSEIDTEKEQEHYSEPEMLEENEMAFEELVPKMKLPDIRKRIDDYFDLANVEYTLDTGTKIKSRSQFRYVSPGQTLSPEDAKEKVKAQLRKTKAGQKFITENSVAIHFAAYGRAKPAQIKIVMQALIDSGALADLRKIETSMSDLQLVRRLQKVFGMGIDCAGYVQLAYIFAYSGNDSDSAEKRKKLGLKERRGDEDLKSLSRGSFQKTGCAGCKNRRSADFKFSGYR